MAEVQSRPTASRGRGSTRAGRGGFSSRGGGRSGPRPSNGDSFAADEDSFPTEDDQGELGLLKKQYQSQLQTLNEFFPDWTDEDLVYALQERNGDLQNTIEDITEGKVSRFADVTKKSKEKSRAKTKDVPSSTTDITPGASRGRGRGGFETTRGGRGGRGGDRGRGGTARGGRGGSVGGSALNFAGRTSEVSVPTVESTAWNSATESATAPGGWDTAAATTIGSGEGALTGTSETEPIEPKSSIIPQGTTKSWASMLATKPAPIVPKPAAVAPIPPPVEPVAPEEKSTSEILPEPVSVAESAMPEQSNLSESVVAEPTSAEGHLSGLEKTSADLEPAQAEAPQLESSGEKLTEEALEHVPDVSNPRPTETVASNVDASSNIGSQTPYASSQHVPTLASERPPLGGFATSAWKATGTPGRNTSFQRMMEQREAVVMPGNHAVDRAAVQFGSMGLNGDNNPLDVEDDREEVETRAQPPQEPLQAQPKASLPPAPQQSAEQHTTQEALPTPKPAPGLDMPSHMPGHGPSHGAPGLAQPSMQNNNMYGQYGRYGAFGPDQGVSSQKPYDAFSQQLNYPQSHETPSSYGGHAQGTGPAAQQGQPGPGGYGQSHNDYTSQYGEPSRGGYSSYYGSSFNQQTSGQHQDSAGPGQRGASGYPAGDNAYGSRFAESQISGSNTPAPGAHAGGPQQARNQSQQGHQPGQGQTQSGQAGGYQYGGQQPYYQGSYYQQYMSNYPSYNYGQHSYGQQYNKNSMYGGGPGHQGYGMSPQTSYEQGTPSNASGFGTSGHGSQGRDTAFSSGYGSDYNRANSAAPSHSGYGSGYPGESSDSYARAGSANTNATGGMSGYGNVTGTPSTTAAGLKPFDDNKAGSSPSLQQPGRVGSAMNSSSFGGAAGGASGNQSGYPPAQHQQGFGGYSAHSGGYSGQGAPSGGHSGGGYGNQYGYGGLGGIGGHGGSAQSQQSGSQYGSYGAGGGYGRGGWSSGH